MSTTSNTPADLYEYVKFITGQDNLTAAQATMLFKYAIDSYSHLAMVSDGVHKFDDLTHVNGSGQPTYPIATSTVSAENHKIQLDATFLMLDRVTVTVDGVEKPLIAIDRRDYKDRSLVEVFGNSGTPTHYDYDAHGVEVFPHPDTSYTATAYYSRAARYTDATDSVTEVGIPRIHHQYIALHVARQLGFRTIDSNRTDVANELAKWEGVPGVKGWIAEHYNKRDEDRPRRLKPKNLTSRVEFNRV